MYFVFADVLADLKKQIVDNDITADTIIAEPTTASSIDTKVSIKTLDKKLKKNAKKAFRKANDDLFYSELSNNSLCKHIRTVLTHQSLVVALATASNNAIPTKLQYPSQL